jgi:site-specific DNA-cytosine methylase
VARRALVHRLRVHRLLVENVPEFVDWGPCHAVTGKPIKARKGEYFRAWVQALKAIGMRVRVEGLTCADYGDATTRERFFLYGRSDKKALRWPEPTHAARRRGRPARHAQAWRSAAEIIDWSRLGTSIFTRKRPLVKNTLSRLLAGAKRNHWPQQHVDALQALIDGKKPRLQGHGRGGRRDRAQLGIPLVMATGGGGTARGVDSRFRRHHGGLNGATPHFAEPIILHKHEQRRRAQLRAASYEPAPTVTTERRAGARAADHHAVLRRRQRPHRPERRRAACRRRARRTASRSPRRR